MVDLLALTFPELPVNYVKVLKYFRELIIYVRQADNNVKIKPFNHSMRGHFRLGICCMSQIIGH